MSGGGGVMPSLRHHLSFLLAVLALVAGGPPARADADGSRILVARPELQDQLYGASILIAKPMPDGSSLGFILNKPTELKLAEAFPGNEASTKVTDPLYLGGPSEMGAVFALVHGNGIPSDGTLALTDNLYLAISDTAVDKAMNPGADDRARFFVGAVVWRPGELAAEIRQGAWYVLEATPELVLPKRTTGLWEELVRQAEISANSI